MKSSDRAVRRPIETTGEIRTGASATGREREEDTMKAFRSMMSICYLVIAVCLALCLPANRCVSQSEDDAVSPDQADSIGKAEEPVVEEFENGHIDWSGEFIEATGVGLPSAASESPAQRKAEARRAAISDAYRQLAEIVHGVRVDSEKSVGDQCEQAPDVKTRVEGLINGAQITRVNLRDDGSAEVTMRVPLSRDGSLSSIFLPSPEIEVIDNWREVVPPPPDKGEATTTKSGILFDATGLGLRPSLSPRIYDVGGKLIYGFELEDLDVAIASGNMLAGWAKGIEAGMSKDRVAEDPCVIRAVQLADGTTTELVVNEEGVKALQACGADFLLRKCKVVIAH